MSLAPFVFTVASLAAFAVAELLPAGASNDEVFIGDHFIQFGHVWRLAAFDDGNLSLSHKNSVGIVAIFRVDGQWDRNHDKYSRYSGWASDRSTTPKGVQFGMDTIQIGNWRLGSPDNGVHFTFAYRNPDNNQIRTCIELRSDGRSSVGQGSNYHTFGQSIFHSNVKYVNRGLEIGGWRIGEWDDSHFPIQAATGHSAMVFRKDSLGRELYGFEVGNNYNTYHGANKREVLWPATRTGAQNLVWVNVARTWAEARDECVARGGWLWSPKLANIKKDELDEPYWTGWNDDQEEGVFLDMSGKKLQPNSKAWGGNEPNDWPDNNVDGEENCVEKRRKSNDNKLNDLNCSNKRKFFCQIDDPANPLFKYRTDKKNFEDAALACKGDGDMKIFRPRTINELRTVGSRAGFWDQGFWVGYVQEPNEGGWRGATKNGKPFGRPMPDGLWYENEPNNAGGIEDCVNKYAPQNDGLNDMPCDHVTNFICTRL